MLGELCYSTYDIFPWVHGNLGKRHVRAWVCEFLSILLSSVPVVSQSIPKPVWKVIYPKYYKNSVKSCTFFVFSRLGSQGSFFIYSWVK